jgi:hypothetical protein
MAASGSSQNVAVNGGGTLIPGIPGKSIRVIGYMLVGSNFGASGYIGTIQFQDTAGNNLSGNMAVVEGVPLQATGIPQTEEDLGGYFMTASGAGLVLSVSGVASLAGHLTYCTVAN